MCEQGRRVLRIRLTHYPAPRGEPTMKRDWLERIGPYLFAALLLLIAAAMWYRWTIGDR